MGWQDDAVVSPAPWSADPVVTPAPAPNAWFDNVKKYLPGFMAESGRKAAASAMSTWNQGLKNFGTATDPSLTSSSLPIAGPVLTLLHTLQNHTIGDQQANIDKIDVPSDGSLWDSAVRGMGSAAATPISGVSSLVTGGGKMVLPFLVKQFTQNLVPAGVGAVGGEEARRLAAQVTDNPYLQEAANLGGSILTGGAASLATGPRQTRVQAEVRRSVTNLSPEAFAAAERQAQLFRDAGATTATAAEAFGPNSSPMALATKTRGSVLDNALRQVTADRVPDLQNLGDTFLGRLGNPGGAVNPGDVSNAATDAANGILANLKAQRGQIIDARQAAMPPINPMNIADVQTQLRQFGNSVNQPGRAAAFHNMADALEGQNGLYTDPKELSLSIANQAEPFANPNAPLPSNRRISDLQSTQEAIDAARAAIDQHAPGFAANIYHFGNFSNDIIQPFRQGAVGTLLDANPVTARITDPGKLGRMVDLAPADVGANAAMLNDPAITGGATVHPLDIAAALAQRGLGAGDLRSTNPGAAVNGVIPYPALEELIAAGGGNPTSTMAPLHAADALQSFATPAAVTEFPKMQWMQALLRPFRTMDMALTGTDQASRQQAIAELLASRDPNAISQLQQIGMFDPNVRRALMLKTAINPVLDGSIQPAEGQ